MAEMGKIVLALFLVAFWLFLPIPMMVIGVGGFDTIEDVYVNVPDDNPNLGFFQWAKPITQLFTTYFKLLVFEIPGLQIYVRYFIRFLQFATALFILIMLRGN